MIHLDKQIIGLFLLLLNYCSIGQSQLNDDSNVITKLRDDLLVNRNYDKMARPVVNSSKTVIVDIKYIGVFSLDLDINTGALSTSLGMFITWTDEHLVWNKDAYQGLDRIVMDTTAVWMPTINAWNSVFTASHYGDINIGSAHPFVLVWSNGTVFFESEKKECLLNYPNDKQSCAILLGSFLEQVPELNITLKKDFDCKFPNSVYECKLRETKVYNKDGYPPFFKIFIDLKRKTAFYFYIIQLPYYSAILLTLSTFLIQLNNDSKLFKFKITILLFAIFIFFFAFSLVFIEIGFQSIKTPNIVKRVSFNLLFDCIYLILICIINQKIQNPFESPPFLLINTLFKIPFLNSNFDKQNNQFFVSSSLTSFPNLTKDKLDQYSSEWINLLSILDKILFIIYISLLVIYHS